MKRVDVREFCDRAARYLAGDDVLSVERHGQPIGYYIPVGASRLNQREEFAQALERREEPAQALERLESEQALERLEQTIQSVLAQSGMSRDELADLFDLSKPLPDPLQHHDVAAAETRTPDR